MEGKAFKGLTGWKPEANLEVILSREFGAQDSGTSNRFIYWRHLKWEFGSKAFEGYYLLEHCNDVSFFFS